MYAPKQDFQDGFFRRFPPIFGQELISIIEGGTIQAAQLSQAKFPLSDNKNSRGVIRRQYIEEGIRGTRFSGNITSTTHKFGKKFLLLDEEANDYTLLRSKEVGLIYQVENGDFPRRGSKYIPSIASPPLQGEPLFPEMLTRSDLLIGNLRALYVVRYEIDSRDKSGATVGKVRVIVLNQDGKTKYCDIVDLREYAATSEIPYAKDLPLPISLRDDAKFGEIEFKSSKNPEYKDSSDTNNDLIKQ